MVHQSLFVVRWGHTTPVCQVSDFPTNCARSREGSVHIRPDSTDRLTQSEVEHIKSSQPKLAKSMRVIKKVAPPPVPAAEPAEAASPSASDSALAASPSASDSALPMASGSGKTRAKGSAITEPQAKPDGTPASQAARLVSEREAIIDGCRHRLVWDGRIWRSRCFGKSSTDEPTPPSDDDEAPECPVCFAPP